MSISTKARANLFAVAGFSALLAGIWWICPPLAIIAGGALCIVMAYGLYRLAGIEETRE